MEGGSSIVCEVTFEAFRQSQFLPHCENALQMTVLKLFGLD